MDNNTVSLDSIHCYTALVWRVYLPRYQRLIVASSLGLTILPVVLTNLALSFSLYKSGEWKKKSKFFIFALGISDTLFGLVTIPNNVVLMTLFGDRRSCWFETVFMFIGQTNGHISFYMMVIIALERYLSVATTLNLGITHKLVRFTTFLSSTTGHRVVLAVVACCSMFHGTVACYFFGYARGSHAANVLMMVVRFIVLFAIYFCYFRIYLALKKYVRIKNDLPIKRHRKTFRTIATILIIYTVCYAPFIVIDIWRAYYTFALQTAAPNALRFALALAFVFVYLNNAINAVVFLRANRKAKVCILRVISTVFSLKFDDTSTEVQMMAPKHGNETI